MDSVCHEQFNDKYSYKFILFLKMYTFLYINTKNYAS
jgi:hypothetical protein